VIVTFTVCQRPSYLRQVLECWAGARGAEGVWWEFAVEPTSKLDEVLLVIESFPHPHEVTVNDRKLGVLENPYQALKRAFVKDDQVVLAEEDLIVSDDVIEYFRWAFLEYADDPSVLTVNARGGNGSENPRHVELVSYFSPHVWGTWRDRWDRVIEPTWDHSYSTYTGRPGNHSGWDWNLNERIVQAEEYWCVFPLASRSDNIGRDGGVHQVPSAFEATRAPGFRLHRDPVSFRPKR